MNVGLQGQDPPPAYNDVDDDDDDDDDLGLDLDLDLDLDLESVFLTDRQKSASTCGRSFVVTTGASRITPRPPPSPSTTMAAASRSARASVPLHSTSTTMSRPTTFNWKGFDEVAELQRKNAELLRRLDEQSTKLAAAQAGATGLDGGGVAGCKTPSAQIGSLSKRVRELTASLNAEKGKTSAKVKIIEGLKANIVELQNDTAKRARSEYKLQQQLVEARQRPVGHPDYPAPLQYAATVTTEALQSQSSLPDQNGKPRPESDRLIVYRQECQKLRKELKLVTSALAKELGDDVPVSRVLASDSTWKGRAEQIQLLRAKLDQSTRSDGGAKNATRWTKSKPTKAPSSAEERTLQSLKAMELQRKRETDRALDEFTTIKEDLTKLKQKYDGSKARNKALSREIKTLKDAAAEATAFTIKTQREIATLKARCIEMARDKGLLLQAFEAAPNAGGSPPSVLASENDLVRARLQLRQKDGEITALQTRLAEALQKARQGRPLSGDLMVPLPSLPHRNLRLASSTPINQTNPVQTVPKAKPGSVDCTMRLQELESQAKASDVKARRFEEIGRHSQRRVLALEAELLRSHNSSHGTPDAGKLVEDDSLSLRSAVSTLEDENRSLKQMLRDTTQAKETEIAVLHNLVTETRRVFSDGLRQFKAAVLATDEK